MQTYQNLAPLEGAHNMASFVARLMSLNAHELQCLHSDSELMKHLTETQLLMESRLQNISFQNKINNTLQQQHQHQISPSNYLDYYSQAVALSAVASQQQQQQHHQHQHQLNQQQQQQNLQLQLLISSHNHLQNPLALDLRTTPTTQPLVYLHHQQPLFANQSSPSSLNTPSTTQLHHYSPSATPTSPITTTTTPTTTSHNLNQDCFANNHANKKIKLSNNDQVYQSQILSNSHHHLRNNNNHHHLDANSRSSSTSSGASSSSSSNSSNTSLNDNNNITTRKQTAQGEKRNSPPDALNSNNTGASGGSGSNKKYKGEFDEPSPNEVEGRQRMLERSDNYHTIGTRLGECACVLGSQFRDKSTASVLDSINKWRHLDTEERIKSKWDVVDLPKDIPLSDIKKFEDLRREASNGRADFGGASKRKPLGIRGTRQFLLILYCLWGHPGRDDVMQKEGYCPHCFAKIKKANEQSTLVRVVNHFNMKHRRGANPRLSPNRDTTPTSSSSSSAAAAAGVVAASTAKTTPTTTTNTSNSKTTAKKTRSK